MAEDYDNNLETIQGLVRKHEGFEADLAAVKEQVIEKLFYMDGKRFRREFYLRMIRIHR